MIWFMFFWKQDDTTLEKNNNFNRRHRYETKVVSIFKRASIISLLRKIK